MGENRNFGVVYNNKCEANSNSNNSLRNHCHEKVDTLLVLHGINVANYYPFQELYIDCFDTEIFLLILYYFDELCTRMFFNGKNDNINIEQ